MVFRMFPCKAIAFWFVPDEYEFGFILALLTDRFEALDY
tara:strand:- start:24976 stop:25092 length:117 start_codon:yes stop_codon:yes gene_type:complete